MAGEFLECVHLPYSAIFYHQGGFFPNLLLTLFTCWLMFSYDHCRQMR